MRILYIEDNPNDAKLVQRYVETTLHELVIVPTAEKSNELMTNPDAFDLVLVDILLNSKREGYDLPQQLRQKGYKREMIAVTALNSPQDRAACERAGFSAVLIKPFLITTLADMLARFGGTAM